VTVQIVGLDPISWGDAPPGTEALETGLTSDQRRALRTEVSRAVAEAFHSAGIVTREYGYPLFAIAISTTRTRHKGEYLVQVGADLYEDALLVRQPAKHGRVSVWSGIRHAVVPTNEIQDEIRFHAAHWARLFAQDDAKNHLSAQAGQQGIGADGPAPR
jgi:hypothetical protein